MTGSDVVFQIFFNGIMLGIQYSLIAVGFTLYFGVLDIINFSHGDVFAFGAFVGLTVAGLFTSIGLVENMLFLSIILIFLLSMLVTGGAGVLFERVAVKRVAGGPIFMSLVATLGLGIALREGIRLFYPAGAETKLFPALFQDYFGDSSLNLGGVVLRYDNLLILGIGIAVIVLVALYINNTKMGLAIRAVSQDGEAAEMMGVNRDLVIDLTFFIGSALAAVAGILNGLYYNSIIFDMGAMAGVIGFSAAVIGGLGNVYGAIIGGFLFAFAESFSAAFIPRGSEFMHVIAFFIVILFLIFNPTGILGEREYERV
jgi:branched-chain amino acid transport system permease protein